MIKEILDKKNVDYCGAYELMKHDKLKQECFEQDTPGEQIKSELSTARSRSRSNSIALSTVTAEEANKDRTFFSINNVNSWKTQGKDSQFANERLMVT